MTTDIERLLADAADDTDRPLYTDIDNLLLRGRRSVRKGRIATASTALLATGAVIGGFAAWSANRTDTVAPAGTSNSQSLRLDATTGQIVDETGKVAMSAPPLSPLSDTEVLRRCGKYDHTYARLKARDPKTDDKAGPVDARWKVVVKSGDQSALNAMFLSPDRLIVSTCTMAGPDKPESFERAHVADVSARSRVRQPLTIEQGLRIPVPGVARVLVDIAGESNPRAALVGSAGFATLSRAGENAKLLTLTRVRAYDSTGKKVYDQITQPPTRR